MAVAASLIRTKERIGKKRIKLESKVERCSIENYGKWRERERERETTSKQNKRFERPVVRRLMSNEHPKIMGASVSGCVRENKCVCVCVCVCV